MNAAVDYLHQHGATYPPEVLLAELRRAGYDEPSISAAWHHATTAPPTSQFAPHGAQAVPVHYPALLQQRLGIEHTVSLEGRRQSTALLIGIVVALAVLITLGAVAWQQSSSETSEAETAKGLIQERLKDSDLTDDQTDAVVESLGGATVKGSLPRDWSELSEGVWAHTGTGNNVVVMVVPNSDDESLAEVVADNEKSPGMKGTGETTPGTLFGHPSLRASENDEGIAFHRQYALIGDDVVVVQVTISPKGRSEAHRKEAFAVADRLQPTA